MENPGGAGTKAPAMRIPDRFTVERRLGIGGFGVVYQVMDRKRNARVALKTLTRVDPIRLYHLKQEFRALAGIVHPNLATLYELLTENGEWLFTMELIEGCNFLQHVRAENAREHTTEFPTVSLDPSTPTTVGELAETGSCAPAADVAIDYERLRDALRQLISGLVALHREGKLHRDIKPSNVLVENGGRVVLLDFGLVADSAADASPGPLSGTLHYMAPEIGSGRYSEASDWYSVGVMLYQCLTGRYPYRNEVPLLGSESHLPADLRDLCMRLLRFDPSERPGDDELLAMFPGGAPVPAAARHRFIGRASELAALWRAYESTASGQAVAIRLAGSSGIGKSALLRQFQQELRAREPKAVVFSTRCFDRESVRYKALDGVVDGISRLLSDMDPAQVEAYLPRDIAALTRVFPVLGRVAAVHSAHRRSADTSDAQELRRQAFGALRELFSRIAATRPVIIFIDDLQWSDPDSVPALEAVLRKPEVPSILLVVAYRAEEAANAVMRQLVPVLDAAGCLEVRLGTLDETDARSLALALGSGTRAESVVREAAGNPFLIDALVRHTGEGDESALTLEGVIDEQVARLPEAGRFVVELLATAAGPLRPDMLSEKADPKVLSLLAAERLVRSRGTGDEIEPYHDRIRETVAAHLPADRARAHHLWLANAFARQEPLQPEAVALHFHSAGDAAAASPYAEAAAERAIQTLAFNQAVALFGIALEDPALSPERARRLRRRLGDALTDAGRAAEAAAAYNAAAEGAPPAERIELLRLAGERLLVSGHFDKGYETMRQVLETVGVSFPETPRAALWSLMWRRAYLAVRGLGYKLRPAESIPPRRLLMMDAFATLVSGFAPIDPVRAMDFQSRLMMHALRAGEMVRLSRAFALEVGVVATGGGRADTKRQIRTAQTLVDQAGDPAGNYLLASTAGMASFFLGRWDETIERLSVAMRLYPATGAGTSWVIASGKLCMLVSWIYSGNLIHAAEQFPGMIADARGRGDLHAQTSLRCRCAAFPMLAAGQPERVWPEVQDAISHWSQRGYHLQHFWALLSLVEADLYCGDAETAWRRVQADWPSFQGSLLRKLQLIHIEAHQVRARAALACAARGTDSARFLAIALKHAKTIEREEVAWGKGLALLIRAGVMHTSGRDCTASLASAEALLRESGMRLYAAAAARRLAQLRKDSESLRAADSFMASQRIADPARIVEALAPGLGSVQ